MIQDIESIRSELQVLFAERREALEQRHVDLVIARTIDVVLRVSEERDRGCPVGHRRLELDRNSIWIHRSNGMSGVGDHLAGERVTKSAWVEIVQFGFQLRRT